MSDKANSGPIGTRQSLVRSLTQRMRIPGASYFVFMGEEGRVRRPRDVLLVVFGVLLTFSALLGSERAPEWSTALVELIASSPDWVIDLFRIGYLLSLVYAWMLTATLVFGRTANGGRTRDVLLVLSGVAAVTILLSFLANSAWPYFLPEIGLDDAIPRFPVLRVALVTGLLVVATPYVTKPLRRLGWMAIAVTFLGAIALSFGTPLHVVGSLGVGTAVAGSVMLLFGTPRGYPSPAVVAAGLAALGVSNRDLRPMADQHWGLVRFVAEDDSGDRIEVKVHGRDSFDSQLAAKVWRTVMYRELGRTVSYNRSQAVEREALFSLLASRGGVRVPELVAVGSASSEVSLIAFADSGESLSNLGKGDLSDGLLIQAWQQINTLHRASISHGGLDCENVKVVDGLVTLTDFDLSSISPEADLIAADIVGFLFASAAVVGAERAVHAAMHGLSSEELVAARPYLQLPAIPSRVRKPVPKPKALIADLQRELEQATGTEAPEPVEIRRITVRGLLLPAMVLLLGWALIPALTQIDYDEIWEVMQEADWALVGAALVMGHLQYLPQSTAVMFAVPTKLPFGPLVALQAASQFITLAIPSSAGRVAMNAAFLHKFGVPVTVAIAQGAIDGFSGFLVQAVILIAVLLTGEVDLGLEIDPSTVPWLVLLGILALIIAAIVIVIFTVEKVRSRIVPILKDAWSALSAVLKEPSRAIGLLTSNFIFWNVLGLTLWFLALAVGADVSYGVALFIAAGTNLFAGFMPIPGGIGVAEATMTALLVALGVDQSIAFAMTMVYRLFTFYLPAFEGFFTTRWLERNGYI